MIRGLSIILCLLSGGLMFSQFNNSQYIKWGVTGNFHKGSIVHVHDVSVGKYGGGFGLFADIALVENDVFDSAWLFIEPQIEYSMQGEFAKAEPHIFPTQKFYADYAAAMIYLKYFFHKGNMKRDVFLFAGPRVEFLLSSKKEVDPVYDAAYYKYNLDNNMEKFGFGISVGSGITINKQLEGFIRFDRGFSKVYTDNPASTYNRLLAVGINYYLNTNWR